jgi:hypothetical protein
MATLEAFERSSIVSLARMRSGEFAICAEYRFSTAGAAPSNGQKALDCLGDHP